MKKLALTIALMACCAASPAQTRSYNSVLAAALELRRLHLPATCDTVITRDDYAIRIVRKDSVMSHIGLNMLPQGVRETLGEATAGYVESALLAQALGVHPDGLKPVQITEGGIADFKAIGPSTDVSLTNDNSRLVTIRWQTEGKATAIAVPVHYQTTRTGSRSDTEHDFIAALANGTAEEIGGMAIDTARLEPYGKDLYILPGSTYQNEDISSSVYVRRGDTARPVWEADYPQESIANLFVFPSDIYAKVPVQVRVLRHEYGVQDTVTTTVGHLLAVARAEGCRPYFGVEKSDSDRLEAALFLYNQQQGYVHVLNIVCDPAAVIGGGATVMVRASLYVPTSNIHNLVAPYKKKTEKERIKYDGK